jgi:hypothetical protein
MQVEQHDPEHRNLPSGLSRPAQRALAVVRQLIRDVFAPPGLCHRAGIVGWRSYLAPMGSLPGSDSGAIQGR